MKQFRIKALIGIAALAVTFLGFWLAGEAADRRKAEKVIRTLYNEIHAYRQSTGQLPATLDLLAEGKGVDWLRDITNSASITYDPGIHGEPRMPRLVVSVGRTMIAFQAHNLELPESVLTPLIQ